MHDTRYNRMWGGDGKVIKPPGPFQKVVNFTKAAVKHVKSGAKKATPEEVQRRLEICKGCNYLNKNEVCEHMKCGCSVKKKAAWMSQNCPIGKWALPVVEDKP